MNDQYIMYAPNGELQDSIQASGVIDISNLNRRQIKDLATSAAGWSGENGGFSANDILSGQADVQGRFTRHEDLFKRKFNKQLNKNLRHTAKMQEIENAKKGDVTALGRYQNYAKEDAAKVFAPLVVGVPMIGTGALSGIAQGGKWLFNNTVTGTTLDVLGTIAGHKNFYSDNGYKKTINRAKEGDVWGTIWSGSGDILDFLGPLDLLRRGNQVLNFIDNPNKYKFKYVDDIGDDGSRWNYVNQMDINHTYDRYVRDGIVDETTLPISLTKDDKIFRSETDLDDYIFFTDESYAPETRAQWLVDNLKGKTKAEADKFLKEVSDPKSPFYNDFVQASDASYLSNYIKSNISDYGKKLIVEQGRGVEDALNFAHNAMTTRNPLLDNNNFLDQIKAGIRRYRKPKWKFDFNSNLGKSKHNSDEGILIGWSNPGETLNLPKSHSIISPTMVAAHEGAHANPVFNNVNDHLLLFDPKYADADALERKAYRIRLRPDSPYYGYDYSKIPERQKQLLTPSGSVNTHDIEINEGYSDAMASRWNLHKKGISSAALDPTKKYTYLDLIRYKMTPTGMFDRFIRQRGGWWKGWKQQLDALNEVYKNGGKLCQKIK